MITLGASPFSPQDKETVENNLLKNIATADNKLVKITGESVLTALRGAVIAAPALQSATFSQDYYFYWVRDGAITIHELLRSYQKESVQERKTLLKNCLLDYLNFVRKVQAQPELNGIDILGEPKFNIDGTLWTGEWSRPQPDGAAYQAIALTLFAQILLDEGQKDFVLANIYDPHATSSLLKENLEYTAANWSSMSIGPWEELLGFHFSVESVQRRALIEGAALAARLNDEGASTYYLGQAAQITDLMKAHWNESVGYYFELFKGQDVRGGGINAAIIFALVYGQLGLKDDPFPLVCEHALSSAFYVRDIFNNLYQVNVLNRAKGNMGPLIGRYPSDLYDGNRMTYGNPWFLCSNMLAAFYYRVATEFLGGKQIMLSFLVKQFFNQIAPNVKVVIGQTVGKEMQNFELLISALIEQGDSILNSVKACCIDAQDGTHFHMSEQINRASGEQASAPDLSWSYASLLTALRLRNAATDLISNK
jgi:glucoamylase